MVSLCEPRPGDLASPYLQFDDKWLGLRFPGHVEAVKLQESFGVHQAADKLLVPANCIEQWCGIPFKRHLFVSHFCTAHILRMFKAYTILHCGSASG